MRRLALLLPVLAATATAADGYTFAGPPRMYQYRLTQQVAWDSAGDHLAYTTELGWKVLLAGRGQRDGRCEVLATVLRVTASQRGPGGEHAYDSAGRGDDALFGHLKAVEGAVLTLVVDPRSGKVDTVRGTEAMVEAVARRAPDQADPGAPSPLAESARQAYAPARLARLWSQVLACPAAGPEPLPLGEPLGGEAQRTWKGQEWTLMADGVARPVTLFAEPVPVAGRVVGLAGGGANRQRDGWPESAAGKLSFTLELAALTQPVRQEHRLSWSFAAAGEDAAAGK
jgi:hypothetical protein